MAQRRRSAPFSMVYGPWADEWARLGLAGRGYAVMLILCGNLEFDAEGNATARVGERLMCERLGCSSNALRMAKRKLLDSGLISVAERARGRRPALYAVMPGRQWPSE